MIAIIYEGPKTEKIIWKNMKNVFPEFDVIDVCLDVAYGGNLYDLYSNLQNDPDVNIIALIQERLNALSDGNKIKKTYSEFLKHAPSEFSEIYMFFDADLHHTIGHSNQNPEENRDILMRMLELFCNETEYGKLYISYPMIEAIKDLSDNNRCNNRCIVSYEVMKRYKNDVSKSGSCFLDSRHYDKEDWGYLCQHSLNKANCIVNGAYEEASYDVFMDALCQSKIALKQVEISRDKGFIYVLSGIPMFLLEYFGEKSWDAGGILCIDNKDRVLYNSRGTAVNGNQR